MMVPTCLRSEPFRCGVVAVPAATSPGQPLGEFLPVELPALPGDSKLRRDDLPPGRPGDFFCGS